MPKINEYHQLVDDSGAIMRDANGAAIIVKDYVSQELFDRKVKERVGEVERKADENLAKQIADYEEKLRAGLPPQEADKLRAKITELEQGIADKEAYAAAKARDAKKEMAGELEAERARVKAWEERYKQSRLQNDFLRAASQPGKGVEFCDPADVFRLLGQNVEWEEVRDERGQPTGELQYVVRMEVLDKDTGKKLVKAMSAEEAALALAAKPENAFRLRSPGRPGSGGYPSNSPAPPGGPASQLNADKASTAELIAAGFNDPASIGKPLDAHS